MTQIEIFLVSFSIGITLVLLLYILKIFPPISEFKFKTKRILTRDIEENVKLINSTVRSLKIVGGELNTPFYNNEEVLNAIKAASNRGVEIQVLCGPRLNVEARELLRLAENGKIELHKLNKRYPNHFRLFDNKHVYLETPHVPLSVERKITIKRDSIYLGRKLKQIFYKILNDSIPINKDKIIKKFEIIKYDDKSGNIRPATEEELNDLQEYMED